MRIGLIACTREKQKYPCPAKEMYAKSDLFRKACNWCRKNCDDIYILSAKYRLVHQDVVIEPYDVTLNKMPSSERRIWAQKVSQQIRRCVPPGAELEIHAGKKYYEFLNLAAYQVHIWGEGLRIGERKQRYKIQGSHDAHY